MATQNRANNADNANDTPPRPPQVQRPRRTPENLDNVETAAEERSGDGPYETLNENRGDVAVDGFWSNRRTYIFDIRLTDTECRTTRNQDPEKVLNKCEKLKKDKHLRACLARTGVTLHRLSILLMEWLVERPNKRSVEWRRFLQGSGIVTILRWWRT